MTDRELLEMALDAMDSMNGDQFLCDAAHHNKKDMHGIGEPCPVAERYKKHREVIRARLTEIPKELDLPKVRLEEFLKLIKGSEGMIGLPTIRTEWPTPEKSDE